MELATLHSALQQTRRRLLALSEHEPLPSATKLPPRAPKLPPPALDGSTDNDTDGSAEDTVDEKQVAEPHKKMVEMFECEFDCGFEHHDFAVAEAHEKECPKRHEAAPGEHLDGPHAHQKTVVVEAHKKVVEMFECEFDCGFEHEDFAVAEAHEKECPKRHGAAPGEHLDGPHAHTKTVNVFECEFDCGFEHHDFAVAEAHEKECPKRSEAVVGEASNMAPISAVKEEVASSSPSSRARDGSAHNALKAFAAKKSSPVHLTGA